MSNTLIHQFDICLSSIEIKFRHVHLKVQIIMMGGSPVIRVMDGVIDFCVLDISGKISFICSPFLTFTILVKVQGQLFSQMQNERAEQSIFLFPSNTYLKFGLPVCQCPCLYYLA